MALSQRARWLLWLVVALVVLGVAATYVLPLLRGAWQEKAPPVTPFDWRPRIELLAGDGQRGVRDGLQAQARFDEPWAVVRGPDGSLFVSDGGEANRIRRIAPDGTVSTFAGSQEGFSDGIGSAAAFHTPSALAIDAAGNLYVADSGNHAIRRIDAQGKVSTLAGNGMPGFRDGPAALAQFHAPMGVAVDAQGRVYVADTWNDRIRMIDSDGQVRTLAGGDHPGDGDGPGLIARFDTPTALAVTRDGNLWIADTGNRVLRWLGANGEVRTWRAGPQADPDAIPNRPVSLALTGDGQLYVGELGNGRVLQLSAEGRARILVGANNAAPFARPAGLWLDSDGSLLLADAAGYRLHRVAARKPGDALATQADGPMGPSPLRALPDTGARWPLAPQDQWHEVVGTLGEVRGDRNGESRHHLHNGLDIRGDVGAKVLAIADGKALNPISSWSFGGQSEGISIDELSYVHMRVGRTPDGRNLDPSRFLYVLSDEGKPERVRIARGTRFHAGEALGTINAQAHVHLIVGPQSYQHNAIRLGFRDFRDTTPPRIDGVSLLDDADQAVDVRVGGRVQVPRQGKLQIVVEAWDQVDGNLPRRKLGLHRIGYQVLDANGTPLPGYEQPTANIDFSRMPANPDAVLMAYAADSGITVHGAARTRFRYVASNRVRGDEAVVEYWQPANLPPGDYIIRGFAEDASGNRALGATDLPIRVVESGLPAAP